MRLDSLPCCAKSFSSIMKAGGQAHAHKIWQYILVVIFL